MNTAQALNVWLIQAVVAIGPPLGAVLFQVYIKTDWGIPLFFLVPLALVAIPALRVRSIALFRLTATWLVLTLAVLVARQRSPPMKSARIATRAQATGRVPNSPAN